MLCVGCIMKYQGLMIFVQECFDLECRVLDPADDLPSSPLLPPLFLLLFFSSFSLLKMTLGLCAYTQNV